MIILLVACRFIESMMEKIWWTFVMLLTQFWNVFNIGPVHNNHNRVEKKFNLTWISMNKKAFTVRLSTFYFTFSLSPCFLLTPTFILCSMKINSSILCWVCSKKVYGNEEMMEHLYSFTPMLMRAESILINIILFFIFYIETWIEFNFPSIVNF